MATETMTIEEVVAAANVIVSALLLALSVTLVFLAARYKAPWSMLAGALSIVFLVTATLISSLARFYTFGADIPFYLLTLRIMALILLSAGTWTLAARARRGELP